MVALSAAAHGRRLLVDLEASKTLGFPLVVVDAPQPSFLDRLSPREREVARLLAKGQSNKELAAALGISLGTVKDHVHAVLRKSGCSSRLEVASAFIGSRV